MAILNRSHWLSIAVIMIAVTLAQPAITARAQSAGHFEMSEEKIKAGLIYNFLKYTTWPDSAGLNEKRSLQVCLFGGDPFSGYLAPLQGRTAQQYTIRINHIRTVHEDQECHVIFINRNQAQNLTEILGALKGSSVLTVSDMPRFAERGGMIELSMQKDKRIHLYINANAARNSGIVIQDRLMKLAEAGR